MLPRERRLERALLIEQHRKSRESNGEKEAQRGQQRSTTKGGSGREPGTRRGGQESARWQMVQRREQRKTQTGAGTAAQVVESLEMVAASAIEMYKKNGADGLTVTDAHALLVKDVALKQGMMAKERKKENRQPKGGMAITN